jgi:hypothetical protein
MFLKSGKTVERMVINDAFEIPLAIKSLNYFMYKKWFVYEGYKGEWFEKIERLIGRCQYIPVGKITLEITGFVKRLQDFENFAGGAKPIPDALKKLGWIIDDDLKNTERLYKQVKTEYKGLKKIKKIKKGALVETSKRIYNEKTVIRIRGEYKKN